MPTECELKRNLGIPDDASLLRDPGGSISGVIVRDGSFDYSPKGQGFLKSQDRRDKRI